MIQEPKEPRTFPCMDDNVENTGYSIDERRLENPRNFGRDGEGEEDESDFDEAYGEGEL